MTAVLDAVALAPLVDGRRGDTEAFSKHRPDLVAGLDRRTHLRGGRRLLVSNLPFDEWTFAIGLERMATRWLTLRHRAPHRRPPRSPDAPRPHHRDERRQRPAWPESRPASRRQRLITRCRIGPPGQCAMARASYPESARVMPLGARLHGLDLRRRMSALPPPLTTALRVIELLNYLFFQGIGGFFGR
jgi:hypothetical protein